jgi:hypothetical protein
MEDLTNRKTLAPAIGSRTAASAAEQGADSIVRFTQIRNYEIQIFGHYIPVRRHFSGRFAQELTTSQQIDMSKTETATADRL